MIHVGIDVAKGKHDCFISNSDGEVLFDSFTILNNQAGFDELFSKISSVTDDLSNVKVGLEATGHYSNNVLGFILRKGLTAYVINPLHSSLFRKSLSFRKTKTDKIDSRIIAAMLATDLSLMPYSATLYHNDCLKSLSRYRFRKIQERSQIKVSISRLVTILFPELEKLVKDVNSTSVYALLTEFPGATYIAEAHLTHLTNILHKSSMGRYGKEKAIEIRNAARNSIASENRSQSLELKLEISLIQSLDDVISEIESEIEKLMKERGTTITTIPGIGYVLGGMILGEIGDISRFESADKILAYAGMSPSIYQSGSYTSPHAKMEKRGSKYLREALYNATKLVCQYDPKFGAYLAKKRAEGKPYNVAISHAAKKLVRLIYALETSGESYRLAD